MANCPDFHNSDFWETEGRGADWEEGRGVSVAWDRPQSGNTSDGKDGTDKTDRTTARTATSAAASAG